MTKFKQVSNVLKFSEFTVSILLFPISFTILKTAQWMIYLDGNVKYNIWIQLLFWHVRTRDV